MQKIHFHSFDTIFDENCHNEAVIIIVTVHSGAFSLEFVRFERYGLVTKETRND